MSKRIDKAPLKDLKKEKRGSSYVLQEKEGSITLVGWHDNNQVNIATNLINNDICLSKGSCKRWSRKDKSTVSIEQPSLVSIYNQGMGGVDLFDKMRGFYRIRIRSKKWYWPYVRFCFNGAVVNMWMLYRFAHPKLGLLEFVRRIVLALLSSPPHLGGPKPKCTRAVLPEIRYDGVDHLVDSNSTQRKCGFCGKCAKFVCVKCNVGLHPAHCFRAYHTP
ncbi:piggyBac transposable element-derived protein 3-like [Zophobas morio]|uniref:piggyBac transposable element-derived protein 3-like n=1 Tax=Zophobas morio TaxID=2755281 RepID=UPI0030828583